jgi:hypothetical protein
VDVPGGQGVPVGDHSQQRNVFADTYVEKLVVEAPQVPTAGEVPRPFTALGLMFDSYNVQFNH